MDALLEVELITQTKKQPIRTIWTKNVWKTLQIECNTFETKTKI